MSKKLLFILLPIIIIFALLLIFYSSVIFQEGNPTPKEESEEYAFTNISNWNLIKQSASNCEIKSVMQTHDLEVTAMLKNGEEVTAREPKIDDIFNVINQYTDKCDEVIMATE